jgi:hypothetical protein
MRHRRPTAWLRAAALALLAAPHGAVAGEWHAAGTLVCTDCHTMHNSQGGRPMRYDGAPSSSAALLRAGSPNGVCVACHGGQKASAPSVMAPTGTTPGGGFPADLADTQHHAHALGTSAVVPPHGDTPVVMTCTTCHDPHGNGGYRNLIASPSGTGRAAAVKVVVKQRVLANGTNPADVYAPANLVYVSGMSQWCMDCHNLLVEEDPGSGTTGHHVAVRAIVGAASADGARWLSDLAGRVPVQNPSAAPAPHVADQVFCLSCHRAHGTPRYAAQIWADGASLDSTCQQCHDP